MSVTQIGRVGWAWVSEGEVWRSRRRACVAPGHALLHRHALLHWGPERAASVRFGCQRTGGLVGNPRALDDYFERDCRVRFPKKCFSGGFGFPLQAGRVGVAPAAVVVLKLGYGFGDGAVGGGELLQHLVDGVGDDGPELFLDGEVVRVGGDEMTLWFSGRAAARS